MNKILRFAIGPAFDKKYGNDIRIKDVAEAKINIEKEILVYQQRLINKLYPYLNPQEEK